MFLIVAESSMISTRTRPVIRPVPSRSAARHLARTPPRILPACRSGQSRMSCAGFAGTAEDSVSVSGQGGETVGARPVPAFEIAQVVGLSLDQEILGQPGPGLASGQHLAGRVALHEVVREEGAGVVEPGRTRHLG